MGEITNNITESINWSKEVDKEKYQYYHYRLNFIKNDLTGIEPQKPINLPDIKLNNNKITID